MKSILSDIAMGGLFLLTLIAAHTAFSTPSTSFASSPVRSQSASVLPRTTSSSMKEQSWTPKSSAAQQASKPPTSSFANSTAIKSYKQWKSDQIQAAIHRVVTAKIMVQKAPVPTAYQQLAIEELGLNAAKSLSLKDYIAMYLGTQPDRTWALAQGAKLLSPDEVQTVLQELAPPSAR